MSLNLEDPKVLEKLMSNGLYPMSLCSKELFDLARKECFPHPEGSYEKHKAYAENVPELKDTLMVSTSGINPCVIFDGKILVEFIPFDSDSGVNFSLSSYLLRKEKGKGIYDATVYAPTNHKITVLNFIDEDKIYEEFSHDKAGVEKFIFEIRKSLEYNFDTFDDLFLKYASGDSVAAANLPEEITIYRGQSTKSSDVKSAGSWSLSSHAADAFAVRFLHAGEIGTRYEAKILSKDLIYAYKNDGEYEVIVDPSKIYDLKSEEVSYD